MQRALHFQPGTVLCNPMCGDGAMGDQGLAQGVMLLAADCEPRTVQEAAQRLAGAGNCVELVVWDATRLPLRQGVLDFIVTTIGGLESPSSGLCGKEGEVGAAIREEGNTASASGSLLGCPVRVPSVASACIPLLEKEFHRTLRAPAEGAPRGSAGILVLSTKRDSLSHTIQEAPGSRWRVDAQKKFAIGKHDVLLMQATPRPYPPIWKHDLSMWRFGSSPEEEKVVVQAALAEECGRAVLFTVGWKEDIWTSPTGRQAICFCITCTSACSDKILSRQESQAIQERVRVRLTNLHGIDLR